MRFSAQELDILDRVVTHYPQFKDIMKAKLEYEINCFISSGGELLQGRCQVLQDFCGHLETESKSAKRTVQPHSQ